MRACRPYAERVAQLPLFPLGTVLVPGARMPLRLFEARYVQLLRDLLDGRSAPQFGVLALRAGHEVGDLTSASVHDIGCTAVLEHVDDLGDGSFHVLVRGERRFRLDRRFASPAPYLVGEVSWLEEPDGDFGHLNALAHVVRARLVAYRRLIGSETDVREAPAHAWRPEEARRLSYRLADLVLLPICERQAVLAAADTVARLDLGRRLLRREQVLVGQLRAVPRVFDLGAPPLN